MIVENKEPYFEALHKGDTAWQQGTVDVSAMEELMSSLLAKQLVAIHHQATGKSEPPVVH